MTHKVKIDGSWRDIADSYVKIDGVWRKVINTYTKINNNWNEISHSYETPSKPSGTIFGVKIDTTNSNPETALTYIDGSTGFTPASGNNGNFKYGSWKNMFPFNQIKPCLLKNGIVQYYLNPNDYTKKLDGTNADITSGNDGDVMVEFPKIYWKFETIGTDLYIRYSDTQIDSGYKCLAHTKGSVIKDKVYISAYMGYIISNKLRSLSGKELSIYNTISSFRTLAKANGNNYEQMGYYQLLMLQILYLVMFKNRDSQSALGLGYVNIHNALIPTLTGGTDNQGLLYGEATGGKQMKFCGIEDWYGNIMYWIDGIVTDANRNILIGTQNFNDAGSGYDNFGEGASSYVSGYISSVQGGTETGFIIKNSTNDDASYYKDMAALNASRVAAFGGHWSSGLASGAFRLNISGQTSESSRFTSSRLMYL